MADYTLQYTGSQIDDLLGKAGAAAPKSTVYTRTEVDTKLGTKVDKVTGKGLSTNDYTNEDKSSLTAVIQEVEDARGIYLDLNDRLDHMGSGGTYDYEDLLHLPKIANVELKGNKTLTDLGIQSALTFDTTPTAGSSNPVTSGGVATSLSGKVDKELGKGLSTNDYTTEEKTKLTNIEAAAQVNIIEKIIVNGTEVVPVNKAVALTLLTNTVNNLANYYLKTETYTQDEVNALINSISSLTMEIVNELPTSDISTTTIYLVPTGSNNVYSQYAYINNVWALLGSTSVDLTNYYTKAQMDTLLAAKQDTLTFDSAPTSLSTNPVTSGGVYDALAAKQNSLTFDAAPTTGSTNPVTSGGVYDALAAKQDVVTIDTTPTEDSDNLVTSGGVYDALAAKQDNLTFDSTPTTGSTNPVTSGGVADALDNITVDVATTETAGVVKPDGDSITVDNDGTIHAAAALNYDSDDFSISHRVVSLNPSQRIFTGTQAEWDALTTAEKTTYGVVNITDDESSTPEYYSTDEVKTNKVWIDGKPIYRVVRQIWKNGSVATGYTYSNFVLRGKLTEDAEMIVSSYTMNVGTGGRMAMMATTGENGPSQAWCWLTDNSAYYSYGAALTDAWAIIEYTKTTD